MNFVSAPFHLNDKFDWNEPNQINARLAEKSKSTLMDSTYTKKRNSLVTQKFYPCSDIAVNLYYQKLGAQLYFLEKSFSNDSPSRYNENMPNKQLDDIKVNQNSLSSIYNDHFRTASDKNWSLLLSVVKVVKKLNNVEVKCISNLEDIDKEMQIFRDKKESLAVTPSNLQNNYMPKKSNPKDLKDELKKFAFLHLIYEQIKEGKDSSIENIISFFLMDAKRNIFSEKNHFLVNQPNSDGVTPLGLACTHGHLSIVKALISVDANHLIKSNGECLLRTSLRWNHYILFEYLMSLEWPKDYIYDCKKFAESNLDNPRIILLISSKLKKIRKANSCCFS